MRAKASVPGRGHRRRRVRSGLKCSAATIARLTASHADNERRILITNSCEENAGEGFVFHPFRSLRTRRFIGLSEASKALGSARLRLQGRALDRALAVDSNPGAKPRPLAQSGRRSFPATLSVPLLCAFFCGARAQKCLESCPKIENVKEAQRNGGVTWG